MLFTPDAWHTADVVDVRLTGSDAQPGPPPERPVLHVGAVSVSVRVRALDETHVRLTLDRPLPLRIGDRALLRDPGSRRVWGVAVLDPAPPRLRRRGAGTRRGQELSSASGEPSLTEELDRRGVVSSVLLRRIGVPVPADADDWLIGDRAAELVRGRMAAVVRRHDEQHPLDPGMPVPALARALGLPSPELVPQLVTAPLRLVDGRVHSTAPREGLPQEIERAVQQVEVELADAPFVAPTADRLRELGLHRKAIAVAVRAGRLLDLGDGIVLLPGADDLAVSWLAELSQPFTTSEARVRLATSRRVVLPLLAHLDRERRTERHEDDRRSLALGHRR